MKPDESGVPAEDRSDAVEPSDLQVAHRAELLPEERAAGSVDPQEQAEAILEESLERTEHPDPDSSTQSALRGTPPAPNPS